MEAIYREAITFFEEAQITEPGDLQANLDKLHTKLFRTYLRRLPLRQGRSDEAAEFAEAARDIRDNMLGPEQIAKDAMSAVLKSSDLIDDAAGDGCSVVS